ncbi:MAG: hypothetical protein L6R39_006330, partial [Caloplaca ligustica]
LSTATGDVPQPAYITGLPADQRAYVESFNAQVASIAKVDFFGTTPSNSTTTARNGTSSTASGGGQGSTTTPGPDAPPASSSPPATNTTDSQAIGAPSQPTGVYKMAAGAAMGVLGVAAFL